MTRPVHTPFTALAAPVALIALVAGARAARGEDVFSPGDLSRPHAALAGLENCTKCHPRGEQLAQQRCLECHRELAPRVAEGKGFHGRIPARERDCWSCHHEHQGRDFALVDWGPGGEKRFDHARTGAPLSGKHGQVACEKCHDPRLVQDAGVKDLLARQPRRRTFLGAPGMASCARCHFDEHRGQLGPDCRRCHGDGGWKPAAGFDHARTAFALTGKHRGVACERCHAAVPDSGSQRGALTAPVSPGRYARYRPVAHASCLDCHKDAHDGRFGTGCARCHGTEDWKKVVSGGAVARAFHDSTRYPLRGAHRSVACTACHGPSRGEPARFKGLAFQACTDCHADAHAGQMARRGPGAGACERCHDVEAYEPARFELEQHQQLPYKLEGAHRVVACRSCHPREEKLADRFPAATRAQLARRGRPVRISLTLYALAGDLTRCETCHADPHAGQLARPQGCAACHDQESFRKVRFDHARDSRFALTGRHAQAACDACHRAQATPAGPVVRYRPLELACAGCHADPHAGQLTAAAASGCERCHGTDDWKRTLFRHEPPFTDYALTGKHRRVACERCHPPVQVAPGVTARRYRPLPRACEGCHADFHKGAFRGFEPARLGR